MTDKKQNGCASTDSSAVDNAIDFTYKEKPWKPPTVLRWRNIIAFILLHLGALYGLILIPSASPSTLVWTAFCYIFSGLGVTAGAHRLWSHRSYKASFPLQVLFAFANSMAFQNSIYEWVRDHRLHHKYVGTDADPHNASWGFFFSHIGWLLVQEHPDCTEKKQKLSDLMTESGYVPEMEKASITTTIRHVLFGFGQRLFPKKQSLLACSERVTAATSQTAASDTTLYQDGVILLVGWSSQD